jgi:hypothetical protein
MLLERRPEKGGDERAGLPEGKVDRWRSGRDAVKQLGETRERRSDEIVERGECCLNRHAEGLRDGARSGNGQRALQKMSPGNAPGLGGRADVKGGDAALVVSLRLELIQLV